MIFPAPSRLWVATFSLAAVIGIGSLVHTASAQSNAGTGGILPQNATGAMQATTGSRPFEGSTIAPEALSSKWPTVPGNRTISLSFKQLGAWGPIGLTGVNKTRYLLFNLRPDEVVTSARLHLGYDYSPSLLSDLSHLTVALNGQGVALIPVPQDGNNMGNVRDINISPALFKRANELMFGFIGHYTRECENPYHSSLWSTITENSRLELTVAPATDSLNDLTDLRDLFAPTHSVEPVNIPVVFSRNASMGSLRAGGVVASWVGLASRSRDIRLTAMRDELPPSTAIVVLKSGESISGITGSAQPQLSLIPNPNNPAARVLVISGPDDAGLLAAARALALNSDTLQGTTATISGENLPDIRKPYDAPAWIPTDRRVQYGEIAQRSDLNVIGYNSGVIRVDYRVPPDLFTWQGLGVPTEIMYRATKLPERDDSKLNIFLNQQALQSIRLSDFKATNKQEKSTKADPQGLQAEPELYSKPLDGTSLFSLKFHLPGYTYTGRQQMQFSFEFKPNDGGNCKDFFVDGSIGSIDSNSWVDFSQYPHYMALPDLEAMSSLGFPFTRMADLSETAVVLPPVPNDDEIGLYLTTMAMMGESTGYPTVRHMVVSANDVSSVSDRDLIVIGSGNEQILISSWEKYLPIANVSGQRRIRNVTQSWRARYRWEGMNTDANLSKPGSISLASAGKLIAIMGLQSPLKEGRSAVVMYADRPADLAQLADALSTPDRWTQLRGDLSLVQGDTIQSTRVMPTYYVGSMSVVNKAKFLLRNNPLILALLALLAIALIAVVAYRRSNLRGK